MPASYQLLQAVRINAIMQTLQDVRLTPQDLVWNSRIPDTPAVDSEIMARFTGYVQIADLVADDQRAVTYSNGKLTFESASVPNLKHGVNVSQEFLNQLLSINANGNARNDMGIFSNWENRIVDGLLLGIRQRKEALKVAMLIDGFSYDRLGIKMSNVSWGMPSDLKVTPAVAWTDAANATPVTDILTLKRVGQVRYGVVFDRLSMSLTAFNYLTATTDFQNRVKLLLPNVPANALPTQDTGFMRNLAVNILGMDIEFYDSRYWAQNENGTLTSYPYLAINKVVMTSKANDNRPDIWDFANGIVTESIVSGLAPRSDMVGGLGGPQYGPVAYATVPPDLNPPTITYWGVARGFPRKHLLQASAVMTVGTFTDTIPVGPPY